jgi:hypothetical protein
MFTQKKILKIYQQFIKIWYKKLELRKINKFLEYIIFIYEKFVKFIKNFTFF